MSPPSPRAAATSLCKPDAGRARRAHAAPSGIPSPKNIHENISPCCCLHNTEKHKPPCKPRFVTGLGVGLGLAIDPVYIAEVSPPKHRGRLVTWSETATNVGILLGFVSGFGFRNAGEAGWRAMLALGAVIPSVLLVLVYTFMPVRARRPSLRGAALAVPSRRWRRVPPIAATSLPCAPDAAMASRLAPPRRHRRDPPPEISRRPRRARSPRRSRRAG